MSGIICSECGRDIDEIGQDNMSCTSEPLCEDCWNDQQSYAVNALRRGNKRLRSEVEALEEENEQLKAEIALIQPDAYMKLPLDADGVPIRIGDVLYSSGNECRVVSITVKADEACVGVHTDEGVFLPSVNPKYLSRKNPEPLEDEPPDSWEKLEADMNLGCRDYCERYRLDECDYNMRVHILIRAKKLAGIEEGAQR